MKLIVELDDATTQEHLFRILDLLAGNRPWVRAAVIYGDDQVIAAR